MNTSAVQSKPNRLRLASVREMFTIHSLGAIFGVVIAFASFLMNGAQAGGALSIIAGLGGLVKAGIDGAAAHRLRRVPDVPLAMLGLGPRMTKATTFCLYSFWFVVAIFILNVLYVAALIVLGAIGIVLALVVALLGAVAAGPANGGTFTTWSNVMKLLATPLHLESALISALTSHPIGFVVAMVFGVPIVLAPTLLALFFRVPADRHFETTPHAP